MWIPYLPIQIIRSLQNRAYSPEETAAICKLAGKLNGLRAFIIASDSFEFDQIANWPSLQQLRELSIRSPRLTDSELAEIGKLQSLRGLRIASSGISDEGIKHLGPLTGLLELGITSSPVTDAGIVSLPPLTRLRKLDLSETLVTDKGVAHFSTSPALDWIVLSDTQVTGACLSGLIASSPRLQGLVFNRTGITDEGLAALAGVSLWRLELDETAVTDAGVGRLGLMKALCELHLRQTKVSGEGLRCFRDRQLWTLDLSGTPLTKAGLAEIAKLKVERLDLQETPFDDDSLQLFLDAADIVELDIRTTRVSLAGVRKYIATAEQRHAADPTWRCPTVHSDHPWWDENIPSDADSLSADSPPRDSPGAEKNSCGI